MGPIGVLCLQGDFREHIAVFDKLGVITRRVKTLPDLNGLAGLVIPGGESTVIDKLSHVNGIFDPIKQLISRGLPAFGTCAGLILLANQIEDGIAGQRSFGGLDITVQRNAFGSQLDSFETQVQFESEIVSAAFIRAPIVVRVGDGVEVTSVLPDGQIVGVRSGNVMGISFHPEIVGETAVHSRFLQICQSVNFKAKL